MTDPERIITEAVARYGREYDRYLKLTARVAEICRDEVVEAHAIRAQVTSRTKSLHSFEGKLRMLAHQNEPRRAGRQQGQTYRLTSAGHASDAPGLGIRCGKCAFHRALELGIDETTWAAGGTARALDGFENARRLEAANDDPARRRLRTLRAGSRSSTLLVPRSR